MHSARQRAQRLLHACGCICKPTLVHLIDQTAVMALVAYFLGRVPQWDIEFSCAGLTCANVLSEALMLACYAFDSKKSTSRSDEGVRLTVRLLSMALPMYVPSFLDSGADCAA